MMLRLLRKLLMKAVTMAVMVLVLGSVMRYGQRYILKAAGMAPAPNGQIGGVKFSSEEADLMTTVFKSAIKLFTGQASRKQLAGELSDKLYAGRNGSDMKELGIEMVQPGDNSPATGADGTPIAGKDTAATGGASAAASKGTASSQPAASGPAKQRVSAEKATDEKGMPDLNSLTDAASNDLRVGMLTKIWKQLKANSIELVLIPVVGLGMLLMQRRRDRRSGDGDFLPSMGVIQTPAESEPYDMKHAVHALSAEDFEMLVALIYQRQGYRVSMVAGLSGGRGGDFTLARKAERILVQCKKLSQDHRIPVERVRELQEAMITAGVTRGLYVASCGFSWDARNFAKGKGITVINARTLDALISAARKTPDEDLLAVSEWAPALMSKVQLTPPKCPSCEAEMDQLSVSAGSVWVCSQRPECRGRRSARKYQKPTPAPAAEKSSEQTAEEAIA
jgi:restriction system protein